MLTVSGLYIYPIKSLGGIAVNSALVTSRGLEHDRRFMLIDENNCFLTQRAFPQMALLQPAFANTELFVYNKKNPAEKITIPTLSPSAAKITVTIWDDTCEAQLFDKPVNEWFSRMLDIRCRLVYMPDTTNRIVDTRYAKNNEVTSFSDAYPILLIGQASLDDLNERLAIPLPMNRFRPNIVFAGGDPFYEDQLRHFSIGGIAFSGVKPCARCVLTTIDQDDATTAKEPLKTLAKYRFKNNKILFGQNLVHEGDGIIKIGDTIDIKQLQPAAI